MNVQNISAKFPGSTHDSHIWKTSKLQEAFLNKKVDTCDSGWLIGDSGYPLQPWLMTPILNPQNSSEEKYNNSHTAIRIIIEKCNGVLKGRFRCLHKHRLLNYSPYIAGLIINTCAVLHNMCIKNKVLTDYDESDIHDIITSSSSSLTNEYQEDQILLRRGKQIEMQLLGSHFSATT